MLDYEFCEMCFSFDIGKLSDGTAYRCNYCGHVYFTDTDAAEQRNEAISDGQKCPDCGGSGVIVDIDGSESDCILCL